MTLFINDGRARTVMHVSFVLLSWLSMLTLPPLPYGIPLLWCACCYWAQHGTDNSLLVTSTIIGFVFDAVQGLTFGTWALILAATFFVGAGAQSVLVGRPFWIRWLATLPMLLVGGMLGWLLTFMGQSGKVSAGPMAITIITAFALYPGISMLHEFLLRRFSSHEV